MSTIPIAQELERIRHIYLTTAADQAELIRDDLSCEELKNRIVKKGPITQADLSAEFRKAVASVYEGAAKDIELILKRTNNPKGTNQP